MIQRSGRAGRRSGRSTGQRTARTRSVIFVISASSFSRRFVFSAGSFHLRFVFSAGIGGRFGRELLACVVRGGRQLPASIRLLGRDWRAFRPEAARVSFTIDSRAKFDTFQGVGRHGPDCRIQRSPTSGGYTMANGLYTFRRLPKSDLYSPFTIAATPQLDRSSIATEFERAVLADVGAVNHDRDLTSSETKVGEKRANGIIDTYSVFCREKLPSPTIGKSTWIF